MCGLSVELLLDFDFAVGFDGVAFLDVVASLEGDTALEVGGDFLDVVFETLEGGDVAGEDHHAVADEAGFVGTGDFTVDDIGTGDVADLGDVEDLAHFDHRGDFFLDDGLEHAFHGFLDFLDGVVDDGVEADVDAFLLGEFARTG